MVSHMNSASLVESLLMLLYLTCSIPTVTVTKETRAWWGQACNFCHWWSISQNPSCELCGFKWLAIFIDRQDPDGNVQRRGNVRKLYSRFVHSRLSNSFLFWLGVISIGDQMNHPISLNNYWLLDVSLQKISYHLIDIKHRDTITVQIE